MQGIRYDILGVLGSFAMVLAIAPVSAQGNVPPELQEVVERTVVVRSTGQSNDARERRVTITLAHVKLEEALQRVAKAGNVRLTYSRAVVPVERQIASFSVKDLPIAQALNQLLTGTRLMAIVRADGQGVITMRQDSSQGTVKQPQKTGTINGRIVDSAHQQGIAGVTVSLEGTRLSTMTGNDGRFVLAGVPAGSRRLNIRLVGYQSRTVPVEVAEGEPASISVRLVAAATMLSGIVTTATGRQRKIELGNSVTSINVDSVMRVAPVTSVTDLLETRVPGLQVLRTSGVPGDPSRLRFRGINSITRDSDPIVIVNGIRINASERLSESATQTVVAGGILGGGAAPSAIDQIDPNSIETIDVFNGPSAAAMYGADAANGVIVITTKKGQSGPVQWNGSVHQGFSRMLGQYPVNTFRFGHSIIGNTLGGKAELCTGTVLGCTVDSVKQFQALNDPRYSVFGTGYTTRGSMTASGGTAGLLYSFTASGSSETGLFELPGTEQDRYARIRGIRPPRWMVRPDRYSSWSGSGQLNARMSPTMDLDVASRLVRGFQQKGEAAGMISSLQAAYMEENTEARAGEFGGEWLGFPVSYGVKMTDEKFTYSNSAALNWRIREWLPLRNSVGLDVLTIEDKKLSPAGLSPKVIDSVGGFSLGREQVYTSSGQVLTTIPISLTGNRRLNLSAGVDGRSSKNTVMSGGDSIIVSGIGELTTFAKGINRSTTTGSFGWFLQPQLDLGSRFFLVPGFRIDGGSGSGIRSGLSGFPKMNLSWLVSDESFFPWQRLIPELRFRTSFGFAGVQPDLSQGARTFTRTKGAIDGAPTDAVSLLQLGNTKLRPERSGELEGGFDATFLQNRIKVSFTAYQKTTKDAIISVQLPYSVGVGDQSIPYNIGSIRNTGTEVNVELNPVQTSSIGWFMQTTFSKNDNRVVSLAPGVDQIVTAGGGLVTRYVPGYPSNGIWERPILGFTDLNQNGRIDPLEIRIGDTAVYIGPQLANYDVTHNTSLTFWGGRFSVHGTVQYTDGMTQVNGRSDRNLLMDPNEPLGTQAAMVAFVTGDAQGSTGYGVSQVVNTLRWQSFSLNVVAPPAIAKMVRGRSVELAVQGSNIGLWTNYRGKDPNVSAYSSGNRTADTGQLPTPRTWSVMIRWRK